MATRILKPWTWVRRSKKEDDKPIKLFPSMDAVLTTTETDIMLKPCKVHDDHRIEFSGSNGKKKTVTINPERSAHIFSLDPKIFFRGIRQKILAYLFMPKHLTFRAYTIQANGELTHDPNNDGLDEEEKMKLEAVLKLQGTAAKAAIADNIMKGLKDKKTWEDYIPWIVVGLISIISILVNAGVV